jgi:SAM-dependent methyltransferase
MPDARADRSVFAGLFLVSLATLTYETLLTRIFSVTMWYHFAFLAVSLAMFGVTVGALIVYLAPGAFPAARAREAMARHALLFALASLFGLGFHLVLPFTLDPSLGGVLYAALHFLVIALPFAASGAAVCVALTRFPSQVGRLYAADLAGAGLGCLAVLGLLGLADGASAVFGVAALAALAAALFAGGGELAGLRRQALAAAAVLLAIGCAHALLARAQAPLFRFRYVKGAEEPKPLHEVWNSFSRITVREKSDGPEPPFGWGLSERFPADRLVRQLRLEIDGTADTVLTAYSGEPSEIEHLRYDVTNLAHHLRSGADVLVIGTGGGRDVLAALAFGQRSVLGVELNGDILRLVNQEFGDFTGHLSRFPGVSFVNDEARSYLERTDRRFGIVQVSLIDTWAATAAGAYALTESSLYTVEAWRTLLRHLSPGGILSYSRWYFRERPGEMYRLAALATAALAAEGVGEPRRHLLIASRMYGTGPHGVGTLLASATPFSDEDQQRFQGVCEAQAFQVVLRPGFARDPAYQALTSPAALGAFGERFPIDVSPPTDDRPFFFHMLRLRDAFDRERWSQGAVSFNMEAVATLGTLLLVVLILTALCVVVPLVLTADRSALAGSPPLLLFFGSIGLGFMLIEVAQMQRLSVFLGHPVYGLSVVLVALLLSGGLGSWLTRRVEADRLRAAGIGRLLALLALLLATGLVTPLATGALRGGTTPLRIAAAVALQVPMGVLLGMPFPLGMRLAAGRRAALTPWLFGLNGAASVLASVLAVTLALAQGISFAFFAGTACYAVALASFWWAGSRG